MSASMGLGGYFTNPIDHPEEIIKYAISELDINILDTSPAYGESEKWIGNAIKSFNRDDLFISTKTKSDNISDVQYDLLNSLNNLNTEYIDVYFGHSFIDDVDTINSSLKILEHMNKHLVGEYIDSVGVSGHSPRAAEIAIDSGMVNYIMVPNSLIYDRFEKVIKYANSKNVEVYTMKNFASGILLGGHTKNDFNKKFTKQEMLNYAISFGDFIIPASRSIEQLKENYNMFLNSKLLTDDEINKLRKDVLEYLGEDVCRFCNECRPCPRYGWKMSQPGILKCSIYHEKFGIDMKEQYSKYNLNVLNCIDCKDKTCSNMCPFGINIKKKMVEAHIMLNK